MPVQSINIQYTTPSNFSASFPPQKTSVLDTTNPNYLRYATLATDSVALTYYSVSVLIPLSQLYQAAASASYALTWPPIILTQPTNSIVTHPAAAYFVVSASAEIPITYQWFRQSGSGNFTSIISTGSYTGSQTPALTHSNTVTGESTSSFVCVCSNASGVTSSSIANLYVI